MMNRKNSPSGAGRAPRMTQNDMLSAMRQARKGGMSPMQFVQQRLQRTPQAQQAMQILSGDQEQLHSMAEQIASQIGIDLNAFVQEASSMF